MMRSFILRIAGFLAIGFVLLNLVATAVLSSSNPLSRRLSWFRVHERVLASRSAIDADTVILGDSVAGQFFPFGAQPGYLTTNGSVFVVGHTILAANVIENSPAVKRIVLVSVPHILGKHFERRKTFNNVIMPFWTLDQRHHFTPLARTKIAARPPSAIFIFPGAKLLPVSDIDFSNGIAPDVGLLSDIAVEYLHRLDTLCAENGIVLQLISPPVPRHLKTTTKNWRAMRRQIRTEGLATVFNGYFPGIIYLKNDQFKDSIHLTPDAVNRCRTHLIDLVSGVSAAD